MSNTIKIKRGPKAFLPTLQEGELALCTDTNELYIGTSGGNVLINGSGPGSGLDADLLDGYHASYFQAMIDQKVDEFIVPRNSDTVIWHKVGELTTDIGGRSK
jgi:hypothetical protein